MAAALGSPLGLVAKVLEDAGFRSEPQPAERWLGRRGSLLAELEGDPVERISMTAPPSADFGRVVNVITNMATPGDAPTFAAWTQRTLAGWAKRLRKPSAVLNATLETKRSRIRLQSLSRFLIVVTWTRR